MSLSEFFAHTPRLPVVTTGVGYGGWYWSVVVTVAAVVLSPGGASFLPVPVVAKIVDND